MESQNLVSENNKILFLIPPERTNFYREIGNEPTMHIGLAYVATYVATHLPMEVKVIDATVEKVREQQIYRIIENYKPNILAMTAYTFQIKDAARIAEETKARVPGVRVIIGGYHVNAIPERTLREFPGFDFAVFGEGEQTAVELIQDIRAGGNAKGVHGVARRQGDEIIINPQREYIDDLSSLPYPDFSLFAIRKYGNTVDPPSMFWLRCVPIYMNRGCPFKCTFCLRSFGNRIRYRPLEHVMGEIERDLLKYRANRLIILDETFTTNREYTMRFSHRMIRNGFNKRVKWFCQTRTDLADSELLLQLKSAGCRFINFGIESGSEEQLRAVNKKVTLSHALNMVREAVKLGIRVQCGFIIGLPGETQKTAKDTIQTALRVDPSIATFSILTPFPGTPIYDMAVKGEGGLKLLTEDWSRYNKQVAGGVLELEGLPLKQLLALQNLAYRRFYLRPRKIFNILLFVTPSKVLRYLVGYLLRMHSKRPFFGQR